MYKQEDWNNIVKLFIYDLSKDVTLDQALQFFASNYTEICQKFADECAEEVVEEEKEESLDVYFDRKMKPMWDYVYNLNKRVNQIEMSKPLIPSVNAPAWQNPATGPAYPNSYKVMCDANGNAPIGQVHTTGYMYTNNVPKDGKVNSSEFTHHFGDVR